MLPRVFLWGGGAFVSVHHTVSGMNYFCVHMTVFNTPNIPSWWDEIM
jgi:hypothetical protein